MLYILPRRTLFKCFSAIDPSSCISPISVAGSLYLNLGKYYYRNGKSDDHTRIYFERIERAENRIQKARDALRAAAGRSASAQKKTQRIPPALRLTLETEAIVSQIEQETDMILLSEKPLTDLIGEESKNQLLAVAAPTDEAEECAFENDGNIPWE